MNAPANDRKCRADAEVLRAFTLGLLDEDLYALDQHVFSLYECPTCGIAPLLVTIETRTGSVRVDFHGRMVTAPLRRRESSKSQWRQPSRLAFKPKMRTASASRRITWLKSISSR